MLVWFRKVGVAVAVEDVLDADEDLDFDAVDVDVDEPDDEEADPDPAAELVEELDAEEPVLRGYVSVHGCPERTRINLDGPYLEAAVSPLGDAAGVGSGDLDLCDAEAPTPPPTAAAIIIQTNARTRKNILRRIPRILRSFCSGGTERPSSAAMFGVSSFLSYGLATTSGYVVYCSWLKIAIFPSSCCKCLVGV